MKSLFAFCLVTLIILSSSPITPITVFTENDPYASGLINPFTQGDGSVTSPYEVSTPDQLNAIRFFPDCHFIMTADIDMGVATSEGGICWNEGQGWNPICDYSEMFLGSFNGQNHTIFNLYGNRPGQDCAGLFGVIGTGSEVKNLLMEDHNLSAGNNVGAIVGYSRASVANCQVNGAIAGQHSVGGIVGYNNGTISACISSGTISGEFDVGGISGSTYVQIFECSNYAKILASANWGGGIAGANYNSITSCGNYGEVAGSNRIGGIAGYSERGTISMSFNVGTIYRPQYGSAGGIIGYLHTGLVTRCYNAGCISGFSDTNSSVGSGGIVGFCYSSASITDCFNTGWVDNTHGFGGIVGAGGSVSRCYNAYNASGEDVYNFIQVIGIPGTDVYYFYEGQEYLGAAAKTYEELCLQSTFTNFDFTSIWQIRNGERFPVLRGVPYEYANGISLDKYSITMGENDIEYIHYSINPATASSQSVICTSSDERVISIMQINSMNRIKLLSVNTGNATITVSTIDGHFAASCEISVISMPVEVKVDNPYLILPLDETGVLSPVITPSDALHAEIVWQSSDESIVTVSSGILTPISIGTATITATNPFSGKAGTSVVEVVDKNEVIAFPDPKLKQALLDSGVDANSNQEISIGELYALSGHLDLSLRGISNMAGIKYAANLTSLNISKNAICDLKPLFPLAKLDELDIRVNLLDFSLGSENSKEMDFLYEAGVISTFTSRDLDFIDFPDQNLKDGLLANGLDVTLDSKISKSELSCFEGSLILSALQINNITGLEYIYQVTYLDLSNNNISNIDMLCGNAGNQQVLLLGDNSISAFPMLLMDELIYIDISRNEMDISYGSENLSRIKSYISSGIGVSYLEQSAEDESENIVFPDLNLKSALLEYGLDLDYDGEIKQGELSRDIRSITLTGKGIYDISGLEYAINTPYIDLIHNQISDVSPLANNVNLTELWLNDNNIEDVSSLAKITNLQRLELENNEIRDITSLTSISALNYLNIQGNNIDCSEGSAQKDAIDLMIANGTDVYYLPQKPTRIESTYYLIDNVLGLLTSVAPGTSVAEFKANLTNSADMYS